MTNKYIKGCSTFSAIWEMQAKPHWFILDPHYSVDTGGQGLTDTDKDQKAKNSLYMKKCQYLLKLYIDVYNQKFLVDGCVF